MIISLTVIKLGIGNIGGHGSIAFFKFANLLFIDLFFGQNLAVFRRTFPAYTLYFLCLDRGHGFAVDKTTLLMVTAGFPRHRKNREFGCSFFPDRGNTGTLPNNIESVILPMELDSNRGKIFKF